jgi:hypothetical protein
LAKALPEDGELVTCEISEDFAKVEPFHTFIAHNIRRYQSVFRLLKKILRKPD